MRLAIDALPDRVVAALLGAAAGEAAAERPAGVRQLIELTELLAEHGRLDDDALLAHGLDAQPATGPAGLLLRAIPVALLTPLDRPRIRRDAHRCVLFAGGDAGTAMVAVATATLAADLCRFDLDTALARVRQTLIEEAPTALLRRLAPQPASAPRIASGDPGDALQVAITALALSSTVAVAVAEVSLWDGESAAASALAGALAGARHALVGIDEEWLDTIPARGRIGAAAASLAARALSLLPAAAEGAPPPR